METYELEVQRRTTTGKNEANRLRAAGMIPAVFYGPGTEPVMLKVPPVAFQKAVAGKYGCNTVFRLKVDGDDAPKMALARQIQRHPVRRNIEHIDFVEVKPDRKVRVVVPLELTGKSVGVAAGGTLWRPVRQVEVECLPGDIPPVIQVDITDVKVGQSLLASQIPLPPGLRLVYRHDFAVATVSVPRGEEVAPAEATATPEATAAPAGAGSKAEAPRTTR